MVASNRMRVLRAANYHTNTGASEESWRGWDYGHLGVEPNRTCGSHEPAWPGVRPLSCSSPLSLRPK